MFWVFTYVIGFHLYVIFVLVFEMDESFELISQTYLKKMKVMRNKVNLEEEWRLNGEWIMEMERSYLYFGFRVVQVSVLSSLIYEGYAGDKPFRDLVNKIRCKCRMKW